jgi:hypothetical protein
MRVQQRRTTGTLLLAMALGIVIAGVPARGAEGTPFAVTMTIDAGLAEPARRALLQEVESIWRDAGVSVRWVVAGELGDAVNRLQVRVVRRAERSNDGDAGVIGELLRFEEGDAVALVSVVRAEAVVRAAGTGRSQLAPDSIVQHRLGTVLGRAVAHEIGHYLLESGAHTSRGLMRATFQPREFTDLRSGTFELDDLSRRRIQQRFGAQVTTIARADRGPLARSSRSILRP